MNANDLVLGNIKLAIEKVEFIEDCIDIYKKEGLDEMLEYCTTIDEEYQMKEHNCQFHKNMQNFMGDFADMMIDLAEAEYDDEEGEGDIQ